MSKSICAPNFDEISQSASELLLLPVVKTDVRHVGIVLRVSILPTHHAHAFCIGVPNLITLGQRTAES